jgi:DNA-binding NarL/FixJ family response regulator
VEPRKIRILAADHNPLLREGLSLFIEFEPDMELVAAVASGKEAVQVFAEQRPDVILMDLDLPSAAGITAIQEILGIDESACIVGLLTHPEDPAGKYALRAGARSCITKDRLNNDLAPLIRDCARPSD